MKRGSALLIVLGMVAFLTISAIAFAAFMRASRLPSSYLRRTSSSRLLVKAALAEAIDEIDLAIGNDLYPGMGDRGRQYWNPRTLTGATSDPDTHLRNYWRANCFIASNRLELAENTVSTLTLEGLAYLPPYMINEARYYSRHARTARWKALPFDSGRYAFSAFDVTDCLDVNRVAANVGRNSSDDGRISLAYLLEDENHKAYDVNPQTWEAFMDNFVDAKNAGLDGNTGHMPASSTKVPLVSLADYSLAANEDLTSYPNPFCDYLDGKDFVLSIGGIEGQRLRNQMFATDSYLPLSPLEEKVTGAYDLNDAQYQPFKMSDLASPVRDLRHPMASTSSLGATRLVQDANGNRWLCALGLAALWDYLDYDNDPISLAIPTTERVPMLCGLDLNATQEGALKLTAKKMASDNQSAVDTDTGDTANPLTVLEYRVNGKSVSKAMKDDATERVVEQTTSYYLDGASFAKFFAGLNVGALALYPFRRDASMLDDDFSIDARLALYFVEGSKSLHTESTSDVLHLGCDAQKYVTENQQPSFVSGVFYMPLKKMPVNLPTAGMESSRDAVLDPIRFGQNNATLVKFCVQELAKTPMYTITRKWTQTREVTATLNPNVKNTTDWTFPTCPADGSTDATDSQLEITGATCGIPPLTENGAVDQSYADSGKFFEKITKSPDGNKPVDVRLQASVWVYVRHQDASEGDLTDCVDLVPACIRDDDDLNGVDSRNMNALGNKATQVGGQPYPLMNFYGTTFTYDPLALPQNDKWTNSGVDFGIPSSTVLYCPDPRWNWAPEHWLKAEGAQKVDADEWLKNAQLGVDGRDRDVFMATSDMGYLQSVYELAFLPRLTNWPERKESALSATTGQVVCDDSIIGNMKALNVSSRSDFATDFNELPNAGLMWRTYRPFAYYQDDDPDKGIVVEADAFDQIGFTSIGTGYRVSPYASTNALMAAFANTPYNWAVAATNSAGALNALGMSEVTRRADSFNKTFAFSEHQSANDAVFKWTDLAQIAQNLHAGVRGLKMGNAAISEVKSEEDAVKLSNWWTDVFDDFDWAGKALGNGNKFADVELSGETCKLSDADKKFLYGYWRECFAPRQQLFLVFVRAEPMMMGGDSANSTPPQLGARAVALVWRDPMPTIEDVSGGQPRPHRTRVLFYRQFE